MTTIHDAFLADICDHPDDPTPRLVYADWLKENDLWDGEPGRLLLLRHVLERPDKDGPRLLYADWCEEGGEESRSEFIRVQLEIARLLADPTPVKPGSPVDAYLNDRKKAERRLLALLRDHFQKHELPTTTETCVDPWAVYLDRHGEGVDDWTAGLGRGFVVTVNLTCQTWLDHGSTLVASHPIRAVRLVDVEILGGGVRGYWTRHPAMTRPGHFGCWPWLTRECVGTVATEGEVWKALSDAALAWARESAGVRIIVS